jgi:hypothetical protein
MPWTRKQVRYLESSGSPLTEGQKDKMNRELHEDPSLGHKQKGTSEMKEPKQAGYLREMRIELHHGPGKEVTGHTVHHHMMPKKTSKSGAFMEETHHSYPFDAEGHSGQHGHMLDHIAHHLDLTGAESEDAAKEEHEISGQQENESQEA